MTYYAPKTPFGQNWINLDNTTYVVMLYFCKWLGA